MNKGLRWFVSMIVLAAGLGQGLPRPMAAAPVAPVESGVYEESFETRTNLDYTEDAIWNITGADLTLSPVDNVSQWSPSLVPAPEGGVYLVWIDLRTDDGDVYAQRFDADGLPVWANAVRVNRDDGVVTQWYVKAASDEYGNLYVVWVDYRDENAYQADIYAQRLSTDGVHSWSSDVRVNSDMGWTRQTLPDIAVDGSGNAIVIWTDYREGDGNIYAQKLDSLGSSLWASDIRVTHYNGTTYQAGRVTVDENGYAVIAWVDDHSGQEEIYAQRLNPAGVAVWTEDVKVNLGINLCERDLGAVVSAGETKVFIVWNDNRVGYHQIYGQLLDVEGQQQWNDDVRINIDTGDSMYGAVADSDLDGNLVVVWSRNLSSPQGGFYGQKIDQLGLVSWLEDVHIRAPNIESNIIASPSGKTIASSAGCTFVAWEDYRPRSYMGTSDILMQALEYDGTWTWGGPRITHIRDGGAVQAQPVVVSDSNGDSYVVAWTDNRADLFNVYAQRFNTDGSRLWPVEIQINDVEDVWPASVAVNVTSVRDIIVAWVDRSSFQIRMQKFDQQGNKLWTSPALFEMGGSKPPAMAIGSENNIFLSCVSFDTHNVYLQLVGSDGIPVWPNTVRVNDVDGTAQYDSAPDMVIDSAGNVYVVWVDLRDGNYGIYAQKFDSSGNILWTDDVLVSQFENTSSQGSPSASMRADGSMFVVWNEQGDGQYSVYAQRLSSSGERLWSNDVQVNSSMEHCFGVVVVTDEAENAVVVWEQNGDSLDNIVAQRLDSTGEKLWSPDIRINLAGGATNRYYSRPEAIAVKGDVLVVWEDLRNGNPDIYGQMLSTIGAVLWSPDWRAVSPDFFYLSPGLVQSLTVDTLVANLTQATLTADMNLNGGSVQFSLTNDGGATWSAVTPGVTHVFTTTGSDLRWRAELTGDPLWPRTPEVNSLRIEYSTQAPYADDYEPDDTCAQAKPLAVNGAVQAHTFHQQADEDRAWFDVISGTTYIVQTSNTQANADTELELRATCPQDPFAGDDNVFGQDARITWRATFSGPVYVKVTHHDPAVYGADTGYDLSVRTFTQPPVVVIVAGHDNSYSLQSNIDAMADMAYRTFLNSGVPKANLRYFGPNPARDVDGNGLNDDLYATVTITGVREAVQNWSREQGVQLGVPFYVYLVDHGHYDQFLAAGSANKVWAADLNLWLSNLEATSGADNINVILEACKSGSFIDMTTLGPAQISGHNRVVIASTSSTLNAYPSPQGGYFSDVFWTAVGQNQDLKTAFEWAKQAVQATELSQQPWLDDNGDAVADGQDGALARGRGLGGAFAGSPPVIDWATAEEANGQAALQAQVRDDFGVELVWAEVYAPDFVEPEPSQDGTTPRVNVPTTTLTLAGSDLYGATYPLTQTGNYRLVVYALDDEGNRALPEAVRVCVGCTFVYLPLVLRGK